MGLGKSTVGLWVAARVTRGDLPGQFFGHPKSVLIAATEDSWEHTIVPRLIAANANLDRVYRIEVTTEAITGNLILPRDQYEVEHALHETDAALLILDPLIPRLSSKLDTHRDGEVRQALEPFVAVADRSRAAMIGLIHHNKSGSTDPLELVMASRAFTAVARSVQTVIRDPDDETGARRLFGTVKNNLGREDLPAMAFTITTHVVATDEGPASTAKLQWVGEINTTITAIMQTEIDPDKTATEEAMDWLEDYLTQRGGTAPSKEIKRDGVKAGHSPMTLKRARARIRAVIEPHGFPRETWWSLPGTQPEQSAQSDQAAPRGDTLGPTELNRGKPPGRSQLDRWDQARETRPPWSDLIPLLEPRPRHDRRPALPLRSPAVPSSGERRRLRWSAESRRSRGTAAGSTAAPRCRAHRRSTAPQGAGADPRR